MFFPYSYIIDCVTKATSTTHPYFSAWNIATACNNVTEHTSNTQISEIYY